MKRAVSSRGSRAGRSSHESRAGLAPRVLVIYKKSAYQIYVRERKHEHIRTLIAARDPAAVHLLRAHEHHMQTLDEARRVLSELGARAVFRHRSDAGLAREFDLVVTLGGDGTLLWTSHLVSQSVPIVAINTAPKDSVGFFCAGKKDALHDVLGAALRGKLKATSLARMRVDVDGETLTKRVLNDVLFAHECPGSTSRYSIKLGALREEHKSSGLWVGPAAGSTAAQHSAGGRILPVRSRMLQLVVREPYGPRPGKYRLQRALVRPTQTLRIDSHMRAGRLYIDGPRDVRTVEMAARIELQISDEPLTLLGFHGGDRRAK